MLHHRHAHAKQKRTAVELAADPYPRLGDGGRV